MFFKVNDYAALQGALDGLCGQLTASGISQECVFDCKLVACELLSNVLKHAGEEAECFAQLKEDCVELKIVSKTVIKLPEKIECSALFAENGRGLFLVHTLCQQQVFSVEDGIVARIPLK